MGSCQKRVRLISMDDPWQPPAGSEGKITGMDALGDLLVDWDCGSSLKLIAGVDDWEEIDEGSVC